MRRIGKIFVVGVPGTGKTTAAKILGGILNLPVFNEKEIMLDYSTMEEGELLIDPTILARVVDSLPPSVVEGHVLCELKTNAPCILMRRNPIQLWDVYVGRKYGKKKIADNLTCEFLDFCGVHLLENCWEINNSFSLLDLERELEFFVRLLKKRPFPRRRLNINWERQFLYVLKRYGLDRL
jgi:broad-specificity NMP kinase